MKKVYLGALSFISLGYVSQAFANNSTDTEKKSQQASPVFTSIQLGALKEVISKYLQENPNEVLTAAQAGMEQQQKEEVAKMEKAVSENKDKIFKDSSSPIAGNPEGPQTLVVFTDPYCDYCKKFYEDLNPFVTTHKDVKVIFKDLPIMGKNSMMTIKAMLAAQKQGKYDQFQKVVFESETPLTEKDLLKISQSMGLDSKKFKSDLSSRDIQEQIDKTIELSKVIGIRGTPAFIIGERKVVPGYMSPEELTKTLQEVYGLDSSEVGKQKIETSS